MDNWRLAELINQLDGLEASAYLKELIEQQKMGKITEEEIILKLKEYYGGYND